MPTSIQDIQAAQNEREFMDFFISGFEGALIQYSGCSTLAKNASKKEYSRTVVLSVIYYCNSSPQRIVKLLPKHSAPIESQIPDQAIKKIFLNIGDV
ncbi:hypothetical protein RclHR1_08180002 [Rhizophagus clarus]|uniref:Uncharacterized protein n=1 Tax=Rhizophagus clarus TaxID=94130 RepID=A0A2Z6RZI6_9GLOM|nr:hypothetical protein RclHR1_08180002 [Rhizophagus clarus]GES87187.1 hypothetical protein RCL_e26207_RclHR1_08180002 [Rhizophagus clarus]